MEEVMNDKIDFEIGKGENGSLAGPVEEKLTGTVGEQWGKGDYPGTLTMPFTQTAQAAECMMALADSPEDWLEREMKKMRDRWCRMEGTQAGSLTEPGYGYVFCCIVDVSDQ
jgi:hypothetical protein